MNLVSLRLITTDITRLRAFYENVTGLQARVYTDDFCEIRTASAVLALAGTRTLPFFGQALADLEGPGASIIEFQVDDVDAAFERLSERIHSSLVQAPTTMPWGNRSLLFRDPDGNLVNLFSALSDEAQARLQR